METNQYIGIDLHKAFFQVAAMTRTGERTWEGRYPRTSEGLEAFRARCSRQTALGYRDRAHVVVAREVRP